MKKVVDLQHPLFQRYLHQWVMCRDCYEGEASIKSEEHAEHYLPRLSGQDAEDYRLYLQRAVFTSIFATVVNGRIGQVFRRSPKFEFADEFQMWMERVSMSRLDLSGFIKRVLTEIFVVGRTGILVDMPPDGGEPYFAMYKAEDIKNWRTEDGELRSVSLKEMPVEEYFDDEEGYKIEHKQVCRYLTLDDQGQYIQEVYKMDKDSQEMQLEDTIKPTINGQPMDFIPFTFINTNDIAESVSKPPLFDLSAVNLAHYRNSADYEQILHMTAVPTPYGTGLDDGETLETIGATHFKALRNENAKLGLLEFSGAGASAIKDSMEDKMSHMAVLGGAIVARKRGHVETAETARIRSASENSLLETICDSVEQGVEQALKHIALWMGWNDDVTIMLNRDFINDQFDAQTLSAVNQAELTGILSKEAAFELRKRMEVYPENWTFEEEQDLLEVRSEGQEVAEDEEEDPEHTMDPKSHVKEADGIFIVVDKNGAKVAEFNTREEAEDYAMQNHDALMNV